MKYSGLKKLKNLLRFHARKIPTVKIDIFANAIMFTLALILTERYNFWWVTLNNVLTSSMEIIIPFSIKFGTFKKILRLPSFSHFLKFWSLIYIQIASNNHKKLMKTLSYTVNKIVPRYMTVSKWRMTLHCNSHDTLKSGSSIQTLLDCYVTVGMTF